MRYRIQERSQKALPGFVGFGQEPYSLDGRGSTSTSTGGLSCKDRFADVGYGGPAVVLSCISPENSYVRKS